MDKIIENQNIQNQDVVARNVIADNCEGFKRRDWIFSTQSSIHQFIEVP